MSQNFAVQGRERFAFSNVRRSITKDLLSDDVAILCQPPGKPADNSVVAALLRMLA